MKNLFILSFLTVVLSTGMLSGKTNPTAVIEWKEITYDFGEIPMNKPIDVDFQFTNPGMMPLIINKVETSCGCTVADYPKQPVSSGKSGNIRVTFDAKSPGYFTKTVTVYSNTQDGHSKLYIKGIVVKD